MGLNECLVQEFINQFQSIGKLMVHLMEEIKNTNVHLKGGQIGL